ncbi:MAG: hypothetical protein AB8H79_22785 [Myxococcota bacterium]
MTSKHDDFFVGYLPMSGRQRVFAILAAVGLVLIMGGSAALAAYSQTEPAPGAEAEVNGVRLRGLLSADPYGVLLMVDPDEDRVRTVLLSKTGKRGSGVRLAEPKPVEVKGLLLERDGGLFLELRGKPKAVTLAPDVAARLEAYQRESLGTLELRGEVTDSKCWHGRMRPGGGRAHRACAQLCISGGIPPVLVTRNERNETRRYLLMDSAGNDVRESILPYVAEPVRVTGEVLRWADIWIVKVDPATGIERL